MEENTIEELERLLRESEEEMKEYEKKIEEIDSQINDINRDILKSGDDLISESSAKILTREQMENIENERKRELEEQRQEEIRNVETNTEREFIKAESIRKNAEIGSDDDKKSAEKSAFEIEMSALEKEFNIRTYIYQSLSGSLESALSKKISDEVKLAKCKNAWNKEKNRPEKDESLYEKVIEFQIQKNDSSALYSKLLKDFNEAEVKLSKVRLLLDEYTKKNIF